MVFVFFLFSKNSDSTRLNFARFAVKRTRLSRAISHIRYRDALVILEQRKTHRVMCVTTRDCLRWVCGSRKNTVFCGQRFCVPFQVTSRICPRELSTETNPCAVKSRAFFSADAAHVYLAFSVYNATITSQEDRISARFRCGRSAKRKEERLEEHRCLWQN